MKLILLIFSLIYLLGCNETTELKNNLSSMGSALGVEVKAESNNDYKVTTIKNAVSNFEGVIDCSVVLSGKTALLGIKTNYKESEKISELKKNIIIKVREIDDSIINTAISTNEEIFLMIKELEE